jgi:hypothetical protein
MLPHSSTMIQIIWESYPCANAYNLPGCLASPHVACWSTVSTGLTTAHLCKTKGSLVHFTVLKYVQQSVMLTCYQRQFNCRKHTSVERREPGNASLSENKQRSFLWVGLFITTQLWSQIFVKSSRFFGNNSLLTVIPPS